MAVEVGQKAPEFTLPAAGEKESYSLSDFRGKNVVLLFFPAAWTSVCTDELCSVRDDIAQFESLDAQVLALSVDGIFALRHWQEEQKFGFPLLSDFNKEVIRKYGVVWPDLVGMREVANRAVFVIDGDGIVRYRWIANVPKDFPPMEEVRKALASLKAA